MVHDNNEKCLCRWSGLIEPINYANNIVELLFIEFNFIHLLPKENFWKAIKKIFFCKSTFFRFLCETSLLQISTF